VCLAYTLCLPAPFILYGTIMHSCIVIHSTCFLLSFFSRERKHYYRHRDLANRNKRECMSVIIDGMDQAKTNLPHFTTVRKCGHGLWRLRYDVRVC